MPVASRHQVALDLLTDLIGRSRAAGASAADAVLFESTALSASYRLGKREDIERSENYDLGLRVFLGQRQAFVSSNDKSKANLQALVERAVAMARVAPEDKYCGLADPALLSRDPPELDLADRAEPDIDALTERARAAEEAAMAVPGVTNSEGAGADWSRGMVALATSAGFAETYVGSRHGVSVSVIAGQGTAMERDYEFSSARYLSDLEDAATIGVEAGERAVKRLNPRKVATKKVPVVFAPRVANSLIGHLAGAITGPSVARGTSFLKDKLNQQVFAASVNVIDDPHRVRGLRSKPFDGEGVANRRLALIDQGRLTTWLLDSASGRQLGLPSTGHASRGTASPPSPGASNLYLEPGPVTPAELIEDVADGFYVTELIGFGVNPVTGDYSRGAAGFWIQQGELVFPVSELTIAGNLKEMFRHLTPANDLRFKYGSDSPTVRIEGMTVAGT